MAQKRSGHHRFNLKSPAEAVHFLKLFPTLVLSGANNHISDYGENGTVGTLSIFLVIEKRLYNITTNWILKNPAGWILLWNLISCESITELME